MSKRSSDRGVVAAKPCQANKKGETQNKEFIHNPAAEVLDLQRVQNLSRALAVAYVLFRAKHRRHVNILHLLNSSRESAYSVSSDIK